MGIFISHANADKELTDALVDLLQTGLDIGQTDIFCSSLEGLGIPEGSKFVDFIGSKLGNARFVIALLTPTYYERAFCLCELGATWIKQQDFFPLLVPPLEFEDLKAVLVGSQAGSIANKTVLNNLRDRLVRAGWASGTTARWEVKRDEFLKKLAGIKVPQATTVGVDKYRALEEAYSEAQKVISEKNEQLEQLACLVEELKKCKDKTETKAVISAHEVGKSDKCKELIDAFVEESDKLPKVVIEAIYHEFVGDDWNPRLMGNEDLWENIDSAKQRGFLNVDERGITTRSDHPKTQRAKSKLYDLQEFIDSEEAECSEFVSTFKSEHDYPLDLHNSDFWSDYLGL